MGSLVWHAVQGIWHYCSRHHPGMGAEVVWTPICQDLDPKTVTDRRGDEWCRHCMARESKEAE